MPTINHPIHLLDRATMMAMRLMLNSTGGGVTGPTRVGGSMNK